VNALPCDPDFFERLDKALIELRSEQKSQAAGLDRRLENLELRFFEAAKCF